MADSAFSINPTNQGTVTSVSVTTANGVSGSVATNTTTPQISLALGAVTPTTVRPSTGYLSVAGSSGGSTTTGGLTFENGLYTVGSSTGGYSTVQNGGTSLTQRTTLNFATGTATGLTAADNAGSTRTDISINAASTSTAGVVTTGTQSFLGDKTFSGNVIATNANFSVSNIIPTVATLSTGATQTILWSNNNVVRITLTANLTLTLSNPSSGGRYTITLVQDATGGRTVTWPATVSWPGGVAPTLSTAPNAVDLVNLVYDGTSSKYRAVADLNFI